jgi:hypothetical protein
LIFKDCMHDHSWECGMWILESHHEWWPAVPPRVRGGSSGLLVQKGGPF